MGPLEAFFLGVLQGISEFLPISSSGHLVLGEKLLNLDVSALKSFDVAVHMGTLVSILLYFRKDFRGMLSVVLMRQQVRGAENYGKLIIYIIVGTLPAVLAGIFLEERIDSVFRNEKMVAIMMVFVGVVYFLGEFINKGMRRSEFTLWKVVVIGFAQALALIPGVSRSGSTIVAGLFQGISREEAARFSFLLGAPAIFGAGIWTALSGESLGAAPIWPILIGFLTSGVVGYFAVWILMRFLRKNSLNWFGAYLVLLGGILLLFSLF